MPSSRALAFMASTQAGRAARIIATEGVAARFSEDINAKVQQLTARERASRSEARAPARTAVLGGDLELLIERLRSVHDHERRHELGDRGDGYGDVRVA